MYTKYIINAKACKTTLIYIRKMRIERCVLSDTPTAIKMEKRNEFYVKNVYA